MVQSPYNIQKPPALNYNIQKLPALNYNIQKPPALNCNMQKPPTLNYNIQKPPALNYSIQKQHQSKPTNRLKMSGLTYQNRKGTRQDSSFTSTIR